MNNEKNYDGEPTAVNNASAETHRAFEHLEKLPKNHNRAALASYRRKRGSNIIDHLVAQDFTTTFRDSSAAFYIPVSWTMTKEALANLLGITSYQGYDVVNGVRFYAGINDDNQLTLVAVSTQAGNGCNDDLTIDDSYPYYDYADPCPTNCSNRGNLKTSSAAALKVIITE